ncbi:hypothetical protein [Kitasatospora sp. NPDC093102]|uniref:hypothetical protein n=1 Tax=Kitasatospora sp. NPDC093102 TaxID=3155069 RepID=UPI00342C2AE1
MPPPRPGTRVTAVRRAREAHFASSHVTDLLARFPELLAGEPQVEFSEVVTAFAR